MPKVKDKDKESTPASVNGDSPATKKGRKRKNAKDDADTPQKANKKSKTNSKIPKKATPAASKTKKAKAPSKPKEKAPVDVEKQCGVELPNGGFCARSLTCKTHSMSAKRAVPGRSAAYDVLLQAYQKRNQVKLASLTTKQQLTADNEALMDDTPLDAEEEIKQVLQGVEASVPVPLERKIIMPIRTKTKFFRTREMMINALTTIPPLPTTSNNPQTIQNAAVMSATGQLLGRTVVFDPTTGGTFVRPPRVLLQPYTGQQATSQAAAAVRQQLQQAHQVYQQLILLQRKGQQLTPQQQQQLMRAQLLLQQQKQMQQAQAARAQQQQQQQQQQSSSPTVATAAAPAATTVTPNR